MPRVTITVSEKNPQPYRFSLDRKTVCIGRGSDNDIVIDSSSVSVQHAQMRRVEGGYELGDMGSTNGIKLRGVRHDKIALDSGMSLRLGEVTFDFTLTDDEMNALAREKPVVQTPIPAVASAEINLEETPEAEPVSEAKPKPKRRPIPPPRPGPQPSGASIGMIVLFLVLAAAAFAVGLSIRHKKETGEALIKAIVNKGDRVEKAAPSAEEPAK